MNEKWLIWSMEHRAWWMPNSHGYTKSREQAGRYSFDEAVEIVNDANAMTLNMPHEAMMPAGKE